MLQNSILAKITTRIIYPR